MDSKKFEKFMVQTMTFQFNLAKRLGITPFEAIGMMTNIEGSNEYARECNTILCARGSKVEVTEVDI